VIKPRPSIKHQSFLIVSVLPIQYK